MTTMNFRFSILIFGEQIYITKESLRYMRSLDVWPRQLSRVTGMNYETIRNIAKKLP